MPEDAFEQLAAKVLTGEATEQEKLQLAAICARDPALAQSFSELELSRKVLREVVPLTTALTEPPSVPIPDEQLQALGKVVRAHWRTQPAPLPARLSLRERIRAWDSLTQAALALCAVFVLIGGLYPLLHSRPQRPPPPADSLTIGYMMALQGQPHILRPSQAVPFAEMASLQAGDQIQLPVDSRAHVLTPQGLFELRGPRTVRVEQVKTAPDTLALYTSDRSADARTLAESTRLTLFAPSSRILSLGLLVLKRDASPIRWYSPYGSTRNITPPLLWKNEPGKTYDVTITDELNPAANPWRATHINPPVDFSIIPEWKDRPLARNGLYRLRISETDNPLATSEITFRTLPDSKAAGLTRSAPPVDKLEHAWLALVSDNQALGDATAELLTLPPPASTSELALKLKLVVFGQLGATEDYDLTAAQLRAAGW